MLSGTNTILFIQKGKVLAGSTVNYEIIVDKILLLKAETHLSRLTVGVNLNNFPGDITTPTSDLTTSKLIFNIFLSTKNAKFMCTTITNFYLNNTMDRYEYNKSPL